MENLNEKTQMVNEATELNHVENVNMEGAENEVVEEHGKKSSKATVVSAAAGVAGGIGAGIGAAALWPGEANAAEGEALNNEEDVLAEKAEAPEPVAEVVTHTTVHHVYVDHTGDENVPPTETAEVLEYTHLVDGDGQHIGDMATVKEDGVHSVYMDTDLDGEANQRWTDVNNNFEIDEGEVVDVTNDHVSMNTFQNNAQSTNVAQINLEPEPTEPVIDYTADAGHDLSMNNDMDMPDYVNDADVDSFVG
ncbi:MAG: hypothetical protein NC201_04155 [Prevotella sp.]|nr:hypothetical protein [Bacteroides sp.]MCM1366422.1 hypothetical protein [Prevotella sp.]